MEELEKLDLLGGESRFDLSCACGLDPPRLKGPEERWIYPAALPDGGSIRMLKVLLDNACPNDCRYCAQRAGRDTPRSRYGPEELARLFDRMVRARHVQALFLSSGLGGNVVRTMDRMIAAVEIVRRRYDYRGFVHLKILPGVQRAQIERAAQLAQRLSINLEVPRPEHMPSLSRNKDYDSGVLQRLGWIAEVIAGRQGIARGHTTQFVVGATRETDSEIVETAGRLYRELGLSRAYYSKFQPVAGTPLEDRPPAPFLREHRLYQTDFLLRKYGFAPDEIPFGPDGNLSLEEDPKTAWARGHPELFPLELNRASPEALLRVPGLGPLSVKRLLAARRAERLRDPGVLRSAGANLRRAAPYLLLDGRACTRQLPLSFGTAKPSGARGDSI